MVILAVSAVAYGLLQGLVVPALPLVQKRTHGSEDAVTWVYTAFLVSSAVATPIFGRLGDVYGKVRMLVVSLAIAAAGVILAPLTTSITVLIVARSVQGAIGAVIPLAFAIIRDEVRSDKVVGAIGFLSALLAAAVGVGVTVGGSVAEHLGYAWLFWIPLVMIIAATAAAHLVARNSGGRQPGSVSWPGAILLAEWLVSLLVWVSEGPNWGWSSAPELVLVATTVSGVAGWIYLELRAAEPLIDVRLLRSPTVWKSNLVIATAGVGGYATFVLIPQFVQTRSGHGYGFGASTELSGLYLLPQTVAIFVAGLLSGPVASALGLKLTSIVGSAITFGGLVMLTALHSQPWQLLVAGGLIGFGFGFVLSATSALVVECVPSDQTGVASGMTANFRIMGGAIGTQVAITLLAAGVPRGGVPSAGHYRQAFAFLALTAAFATIVSFVLPGIRRVSRLTAGLGASAPGELV
jgi:MFS family permease